MNITIGSNFTNITSALSGMSDAQVIAKYCSDFSFFTMSIYGIIFLLILCRALISREKNKNPGKPEYEKAYKALDDLTEMLTIGLIIFTFTRWLLF